MQKRYNAVESINYCNITLCLIDSSYFLFPVPIPRCLNAIQYVQLWLLYSIRWAIQLRTILLGISQTELPRYGSGGRRRRWPSRDSLIPRTGAAKLGLNKRVSNVTDMQTTLNTSLTSPRTLETSPVRSAHHSTGSEPRKCDSACTKNVQNVREWDPVSWRSKNLR